MCKNVIALVAIDTRPLHILLQLGTYSIPDILILWHLSSIFQYVLLRRYS
jgi:hypothetical protein